MAYFNVYIAVCVFLFVLYFDLNMQLLMTKDGRKELMSMSRSTMWQHILRAVALLVSILQISFAFKQMSEINDGTSLGLLSGLPILLVMGAIAYLFCQKRVMGGSLAAVYAITPAWMYLGLGPMSTAYSTIEKTLELMTVLIAMLSTTITAFAESRALAIHSDEPDDEESGRREEERESKRTAKRDAQAKGRTRARTFGDQATEMGAEAKEIAKIMADLGVSIDKANQTVGASASRGKYQVANFMFLVVLFGTELDMMSFFVSIPGFWGYNIDILRFLLFMAFFSFAFPLLINLYLQTFESNLIAAPDDTLDNGPVEPSRIHSFIDWLRTQNRVRNPFGGEVQWFHVVPCFRFYLLLKVKINNTDVDAIFKVNSLSSFTLGIYQLLGIVFTVLFGHELTMLVKMNIIAQALNWLVTIIYFTTPLAAWMGRAAEVRGISRMYQGLMNKWVSLCIDEDSLAFGVEESTTHASAKAQRQKTKMKANIVARIQESFLHQEGDAVKDFNERIRDGDVRVLIECLRDQAISSIEMNNAM
jgi:hypothetical protein